jgi:hypothetical protein
LDYDCQAAKNNAISLTVWISGRFFFLIRSFKKKDSLMKIKTVYWSANLLVIIFLMLNTNLIGHASTLSANSQATVGFVFRPIADAYVTRSAPASNFGSSLSLYTSAYASTTPVRRSYLRFVVKGLNGSRIQSAKLLIYANKASTSGFSVHALGNNTWIENKITYNNSPAVGNIIKSSGPFNGGVWVIVDLSAYIKTEGTYNLVLTTTNSTNVNLSSRETLRYPRLRINTVVATPTPTPKVTSTPDWQPSFPIRAAFYYPWFSQAWTQSGIYPYTNYTPSLGYYSSTDINIIKRHINMMQYGRIQAGIASWWGQGNQTDTKIAGLLSASSGTQFRWSLYYENESVGDPSVSQIHSDLVYIHNHYGTNPNFLRVNGKFVIFVYASVADRCGMADRWKQANTVGAYIVLKVFSGYTNCASQPNSWHQYSPAVASDQQGSLSFSISPGFWLKGSNVRLTRDINRWTRNVKGMVSSGAKWQLITTFSEWGEGTAVEPALQWASSSGYGQYLDVLHYNGNIPTP